MPIQNYDTQMSNQGHQDEQQESSYSEPLVDDLVCAEPGKPEGDSKQNNSGSKKHLVWQTWFTAIIAFATTVNAIVANCQWHTMKQMIQESQRATDAAWEAVWSKDRPWVFVSQAALTRAMAENNEASLQILNVGDGLAMNMRYEIAANEAIEQPRRDDRGKIVDPPADLLARTKGDSMAKLLLPQGQGYRVIKGVRRVSGEGAVVSGLVRYFDSHGRDHLTVFCVRLASDRTPDEAYLCPGWTKFQEAD